MIYYATAASLALEPKIIITINFKIPSSKSQDRRNIIFTFIT